jgi:hypothetical protein
MKKDMTKISIKTILFAVLCTIVLIFSACTHEEESDSIPNNIWFIDNKNTPPLFHTNNITMASQEIPFELVLPTYLPNNLNPEKPNAIIGPYQTTEEVVEVSIQYPKILIIEKNEFVNRISDPSTSYYLEINETKVLREITSGTIIPTNEYLPGVVFTWNSNGIFFTIIIDDIYSDDEYFKIIESMIR